MMHHRQDQLFLYYFFAVLSVVLCIISHNPAEALYDAAICAAAETAAASASTCDQWLSINQDLANGDCCAATLSVDLNTCNPLCSTVITGMVDTCDTRQQFQNFKVKGESCQNFTVHKAITKPNIGCEEWGSIIQGDARIFCAAKLGKYKDWDYNCTETCVDIIRGVPSFCVVDAIDYWIKTPIRDFHENCTSVVVEKVTNKTDLACVNWKSLLELSINSQVGCGHQECTPECKELITKVEAGCPGYIAINQWNTIACAYPSGAALGAQPTFAISMILGSFLAYLGLEMVSW